MDVIETGNHPVILAGQVTEKRRANVEVSRESLKEATMENFNTLQIVHMAKVKWLASRGLRHDAFLNEEGEWTIFEDHGSHYTGNYPCGVETLPEDIVMFEAFQALIKRLC